MKREEPITSSISKALDFRTYFPVEPSRSLAFKYCVTGVVLPCICYFIAVTSRHVGIHAPWQSGNIQDYVTLILSAPTVLVFLPIKIFAMAGLSRWLMDPKARAFVWVQIAIGGGVLLSLQVLILAVLHSKYLTLMAAGVFGGALAASVFIFQKLVTRKIQITVAKLLLLMTIMAMIAGLSIRYGFEWIGMLIISVPLAAPTLAFATFLRAAIAIYSEANPSPVPRRFPIAMVSYISAWLISWRLAVSVMLAEYQRLPTTNPNCYICSAAAYGHARWVRAEWITNEQGDVIRVNRQMQSLKFLELVFRSASPQLHAILRSAYDTLGPPLARCCRSSRFVSDFIYVSLMPLEQLAELLRCLLAIPRSEIDQFWKPRPIDSA